MGFKRISDAASALPPLPPMPTPAEISAQVAERVRAELGVLRAKAEAEGRAKGEAEGRANFEKAEVNLKSVANALAKAAGQLADPLARKESELAELTTNLAMIIARHVVGAEVSVRPEGLAQLVTVLLAEATAERAPRQDLKLHLHPDDATALDGLVDMSAVILQPDDAMVRGGARVELLWPDGDPVNKTEWDATLPSRLDLIAAALRLPVVAPMHGASYGEQPI